MGSCRVDKKGLLWGPATNYWSHPLAPPGPYQLHHGRKIVGRIYRWNVQTVFFGKITWVSVQCASLSIGIYFISQFKCKRQRDLLMWNILSFSSGVHFTVLNIDTSSLTRVGVRGRYSLFVTMRWLPNSNDANFRQCFRQKFTQHCCWQCSTKHK